MKTIQEIRETHQKEGLDSKFVRLYIHDLLTSYQSQNQPIQVITLSKNSSGRHHIFRGLIVMNNSHECALLNVGKTKSCVSLIKFDDLRDLKLLGVENG